MQGPFFYWEQFKKMIYMLDVVWSGVGEIKT
jgi:hypothetical protein